MHEPDAAASPAGMVVQAGRRPARSRLRPCRGTESSPDHGRRENPKASRLPRVPADHRSFIESRRSCILRVIACRRILTTDSCASRIRVSTSSDVVVARLSGLPLPVSFL